MGTATWPELSGRRPLLILPLGAWEQHGPHLPLDTDSIIINRVVEEVMNSAELAKIDAVVAPTMSITASDEHHGFPGSLSTGSQALKDSVVAICRSASWARGICIVNGHGGNFNALKEIESALHFENIMHSIWSLPAYVGGDMHAGHTETSLLLHISPNDVRTHLMENGVHQHEGLLESMQVHGVQGVSKNGIIGNPTHADANHGEAVLSLYTKSLAAHLLATDEQWAAPS